MRLSRLGVLSTAAFVLVPLAACGGNTLDGGKGSTGGAGGDPGDGGGGAGDTSPAGIAARCGGEHGAQERPATAAAFARAIMGRWFTCNFWKDSPFAFTSHEGIEFLPDGHWFGLHPDGAGGYRRDLGVHGYGTYSIYSGGKWGLVPNDDTTPTDSKSVYLHMNENILDVFIDFEVSPRRFHTFSGTDLWFVPADPGPVEPLPYQSKEGETCDNLFVCRAGLTCTTFPVTDYQVASGQVSVCTK